MTNCPNCGAPARGRECAYCGTPLEEPSIDMAIGQVVHASFERDGRRFSFDFMVDQVELANEVETTDFYADASVFYTMCTPRYRVAIDGTVVEREAYGRKCIIVTEDLK